MRYFICESFRGLNFPLFSSFPVSVKPLLSAMLWCTLSHVDIQQYMYCLDCMILCSLCHFNLSLSQKGRGSYLFLILLILFLVFPLLLVYLGGDVLLISSPLGLPFVAIFSSLYVQLLRFLSPLVVMVLTYVCEIIIHGVCPHHYNV